MYLSKQDRSFDVTNSTPRVTDMEEFNPVIFSSGAVKFMVRIGTTIYKVELST